MSLGKKIASPILQLTLSNIVVRLLSLVTMPLLTRILSPDAYGTAALAGTMISLFSVFALSGVDMSYARAYHAKAEPSGAAVEAFVWRYALGVGLTAAVIGAVAWWLLLADTFELPAYLAGLLGFGIMLSIVNTMSQTRARLNNQYRRMSISIVAASVGAVAVSIGVAMWWRQDELPLILSMVVGYLIPVLILGAPTCAMLCKASGLGAVDRANVLKIGLAGIITAPMYWVISSLDRWYLGYFEGAASVGIYSIGYSVAIMGMMVNNALTSVWLPEASRAFENNPEEAQVQLGRLAERLIVALGVVWLTITTAGGDLVRLLAGPQFHSAAVVVPYIAGAVFFHGVLHLANTGLLLKKKLHYAIWWWLAAAVLCVALNLLLIPLLGRLGAAITQTGSFALVAIGIVFSAQRLFPLKFRIIRLTGVILVILLLGIFMHQEWSGTPLVSLLFKLPVGVVVTLLVIKLMAPDVLCVIAQRIGLEKKSVRG